jgi:hypothetical protein
VTATRELLPYYYQTNRTTSSGSNSFYVYIRCAGAFCGFPVAPVVVTWTISPIGQTSAAITAVATVAILPTADFFQPVIATPATSTGSYTMTASTATPGIASGTSSTITVN